MKLNIVNNNSFLEILNGGKIEKRLYCPLRVYYCDADCDRDFLIKGVDGEFAFDRNDVQYIDNIPWSGTDEQLLQQLDQFAEDCECCGGGTTTPPNAALLTDGTIQAVCDAKSNIGAVYFVQVIYDEDTGSFTYKRVTDGTMVNAGDFRPCEDIKTVKECYVLQGNPDRYFSTFVCIQFGQVISSLIYEEGVGLVASLPAGVERCSTGAQPTRKFIKASKFPFNGTDPIQIFAGAPPESTLAEIQIQGADLQWIFGAPANVNSFGYHSNMGQIIELESPSEIELFTAKSLDGNAGCLIVSFYTEEFDNV